MEGRYWEENGHSVKYENYTNTEDGFRSGDGHLNFSTGVHSDDEADYPPGSYLKKAKQDPMSHRIIEKRRRDRMNNCLADLSRLIPPHYLKKGRGRVEKTEIIEMAIRHLKYLQDRPTPSERVDTSEQWGAGYQECLGEAARFMMREQQTPNDGVCLQLVAHLQKHYENRVKGSQLAREAPHPAFVSNGIRGGVIRHPARYEPYAMDSDKGEMQTVSEESTTSAVDSGTSTELEARVSSPHLEDHPSYKFKNSIRRRFSRSQDTEYCQAQDMSVRRSCPKPPSADDSAQHTPLVPIFALHSDGKYYVPLSVRDAYVSRHVRAGAGSPPPAGALHTVALHVRFTSCEHQPEPSESDCNGDHPPH